MKLYLALVSLFVLSSAHASNLCECKEITQNGIVVLSIKDERALALVLKKFHFTPITSEVYAAREGCVDLRSRLTDLGVCDEGPLPTTAQ